MQAAHLPAEGLVDSVVRVVAFEDLQCPDCAAWRRMLDERLLPHYGGRVAFETRDFPLAKHRWAEPAAIAARLFAAHRAESGVAFRRYLYAEQANISAENLPERISDFALRAGYDEEEAVESLRNPVFLDAVRNDFAEGEQAGVEKTPTIVVGSERLIERFSEGDVAAAIDRALQAAEATS